MAAAIASVKRGCNVIAVVAALSESENACESELLQDVEVCCCIILP